MQLCVAVALGSVSGQKSHTCRSHLRAWTIPLAAVQVVDVGALEVGVDAAVEVEGNYR